MHSTEVTELHIHVGNSTAGTGSLKQHSGPTQDSGSISSLLHIFPSFYVHYYISISFWHIITSLLRHYYVIITVMMALFLAVITSVFTYY